VTPRRVVVIGGSLAGLAVVEGLRRRGFDGSVTVVSAELFLPYDRPPLSKAALASDERPEPPYLRAREQIDALGAEWLLGTRATALRKGAVETTAGTVPYDAAVVATGAVARLHPHVELRDGVHVVRTIDDSQALHADSRTATHAVVVGGGLIGCEVAATLRGRGLAVTILERSPTLLGRSLGPECAALLAAMHRAAGVTVRTQTTVTGLLGGTRGEGVRLADGSQVAADLVVLGLGATPDTGWLRGGVVALDDGVLCDRFGRTSVPGVWAAGDVARSHSAAAGRLVRTGHWTAATTAGDAVAANILATTPATDVVGRPYLWTDQYGVRAQLVGAPARGDAVHLDVTQEGRRAVGVFSREGTVTAGFALGAASQLARLGRLLGHPLPEEFAMAHSA
jgi:NADPH-dependent 2,4-dienoyl-CoA reductase/sulfur reductase-like enzyme